MSSITPSPPADMAPTTVTVEPPTASEPAPPLKRPKKGFCRQCKKRPVARHRSKSRCDECLDKASEVSARKKSPRTVKLCDHCKLRPARVKFCCDECRIAAQRERDALDSPKKMCRRKGCPNTARLKYCTATCRVMVYKERQRQAQAPVQCGICGLPGHTRDKCMHPAAVRLPSLRAVADARRCSICGDHMHDARFCPKADAEHS